jgi:phosphoheptose isomerase
MSYDSMSCREYLQSVADVAQNVPFPAMKSLRQLVAITSEEHRTIFAAGNGGGATVAEHFVLGMSLNVFRETGEKVKAFSLCSSGTFLSAAANDFGYEEMFAVQLRSLAQPKDLFIAVSASGKSKNLVHAVQAAREMGVKTGVLVGTEGPVSASADLAVVLNTTSAPVMEDVAIMLLHWLYSSFMVKS